MFSGLLTAIVFVPAVAALGVVLLKRDQTIRWFAIGATVFELVLTVILFAAYDRAQGGVQFVDHIASWIPIAGLRAEYLLGVDGLSLPLVLLTGILGAAAAFASWKISTRVKEYFAWLLILQTAVR